MKPHYVPTAEQGRLLRQAGLDTVAGAFDYEGGELLSKPNLGTRQRIRLTLTGDDARPVTWYLKRYGPVSLLRRLALLPFSLGRPSPARREFENIRLVQAAGIATMEPIAFGDEPGLVGIRRSYLVVTSVPGEALERCFEAFLREADEDQMRQFNAALVDLVVRLHEAGLAHRDLYASHVFLDRTGEGPRLYLIDLARVLVMHVRKFRWQVKDLAQLKYSLPARWVEEHWESFLSANLGDVGDRERRRWGWAVAARADAMLRRQRRRAWRARRG
ncbi:MAG TPA: lipopolysaccharide kinase InaA family protein [Phycisphaerae bacterium]|nr:lipopolysaccharide kinase InaA family protein [Phycisphaerae bacterium]